MGARDLETQDEGGIGERCEADAALHVQEQRAWIEVLVWCVARQPALAPGGEGADHGRKFGARLGEGIFRAVGDGAELAIGTRERAARLWKADWAGV